MKKIIFILLVVVSNCLIGQQIKTNNSFTTTAHTIDCDSFLKGLSNIQMIVNMSQGKVLYTSDNPNRYYDGNYRTGWAENSVPGLYIDSTDHQLIHIANQAPSIATNDIIFLYLVDTAAITPGGDATASNQVTMIGEIGVVNSNVAALYNKNLILNLITYSLSDTTLAGLITQQNNFFTSNPSSYLVSANTIIDSGIYSAILVIWTP